MQTVRSKLWRGGRSMGGGKKKKQVFSAIGWTQDWAIGRQRRGTGCWSGLGFGRGKLTCVFRCVVFRETFHWEWYKKNKKEWSNLLYCRCRLVCLPNPVKSHSVEFSLINWIERWFRHPKCWHLAHKSIPSNMQIPNDMWSSFALKIALAFKGPQGSNAGRDTQAAACLPSKRVY